MSVSAIMQVSNATSQELAVITDTAGTSQTLSTIKVKISEDIGRFYGKGSRLDGIYESPNTLPLVQKGGVILFVPLATIKEYVAGKTSGITLINGNRLHGIIPSEVTIMGDAALGKLSIGADKLRRIEIKSGAMETFLKKQRKNYAPDWPAKYSLMADAVLISGQALGLENVALVYRETGCDPSWMPCRSYAEWGLMQDLPIKSGEFKTKIPFAKITEIKFGAKRANTITLPFTLLLATNQQVSGEIDEGVGILKEDVGFLALGLLGNTEAGYVHVPLDLLKTVRFRSKK